MRSTIRDTYNAMKQPRNMAIFLTVVIFAVLSLSQFGYITWRRFITPTEIVAVAIVLWKIARLINHDGISAVVNAASVGLGTLGLMTYIGGIIDTIFFPPFGYVQFAVNVTMWGWVLMHLIRALSILISMSPDGREIVTESSAAIYAQMTYREGRMREVREHAEKSLRLAS